MNKDNKKPKIVRGANPSPSTIPAGWGSSRNTTSTCTNEVAKNQPLAINVSTKAEENISAVDSIKLSPTNHF